MKKSDSTSTVKSIYSGKTVDLLGISRSIHRVGCGLRKAAQGWRSAARLYAPIRIYKQTKGSEKMEEESNRIRKTKIGEKRPSKRKTVSQTMPCDMCGDTQWDEDLNRGETYCLSCGNVVEVNTIDPGAEWTNHTDGADRSRVGAPARNSLSDKGLNTTIAQSDVSGPGAQRNGIKGSNAKDWRRWRIMDERSKNRSSPSRNLTKAMQFIRDKGGLPPSLTECAAHLYRKAAKMGVVTGRSIRGVSAACVYLTAREVNLPRTIDDVPIWVVIPAFVLSELKTAFQIGFVIYIPFLVIDMVVSAVLMAMGMMMLPPIMISLPFKLMLFVLVDGWHLLVGSMVKSFVPI